MFKVIEVKKTIPQDLPTHWSVYRGGEQEPVLTVWSSRSMADKVCEMLNHADALAD